MAGDPGGAKESYASSVNIVEGRTLTFAPLKIQVFVKFAPSTFEGYFVDNTSIDSIVADRMHRIG